MDPVIRPAATSDADELRRLEVMARANIADERGGERRLEECPLVGTDWEALLADADWRVFVAVIGDVPVGYMAMQLRRSLDRGVVHHAFVENEARELGFGDALLRASIDEVVAADLHGIEGTALPGDRETKNLFERCGLVARKITVYKRLD
jgi:GNAT superfamily N-acetyltransferase